LGCIPGLLRRWRPIWAAQKGGMFVRELFGRNHFWLIASAGVLPECPRWKSSTPMSGWPSPWRSTRAA